MKSTKPRVVVVGAGFGGLRVARALRDKAVDVAIVDQHNYHTFIPLLYQVATAGLEPEAIAQPIRRIVRAKNVRFRLARVTAADIASSRVLTEDGEIKYDYLVLAAGSVTNYFGIDSVADSSSALRDLDDAEALRSHVLNAFETAASEPNVGRRAELMTTVVVGGGPTGLEMAGALSELRKHVLPHDFPGIDTSQARVVLLEAADRLLGGMHPSMQRRALTDLEKMDVDVHLNTKVADADMTGVTLVSGERIPAGTVIWVAGVRAPSLAESLSAAKGSSGRICVTESLHLPDDDRVYVIGDIAHVGGPSSPAHPMLAPVAIQQGELAAENILRHIAGKELERFKYKDRGTMVTIGRSRAVARIYGLRFSGFLAWVIWLTVHLVWLIGFRNRALVLVNWAWNYLTYDRGVRLIRDRR